MAKITKLTVTYEDGTTQAWEGDGHVLPPTNARSTEKGQVPEVLISASIVQVGKKV